MGSIIMASLPVSLLVLFSCFLIGNVSSASESNVTSIEIEIANSSKQHDPGHYGYYYYEDDLKMTDDTNENGVTKDEVQILITTQIQHFMKSEFKDNVRLEFKNLQNLNKNCVIEHGEYWYYDYELKDCRDCFRKDCSENDLCVATCGERLRVKSLEEHVDYNYKIAAASFALNVVLFLATAVLIYFVYDLWKKYQTVNPIRKTKAKKPEVDEAAEKLVKPVRDSGVDSEVALDLPEN